KVGKQPGRHVGIVLQQVPLGDPESGPVHFLKICKTDPTASDGEFDRFGSEGNLHRSRGSTEGARSRRQRFRSGRRKGTGRSKSPAKCSRRALKLVIELMTCALCLPVFLL